MKKMYLDLKKITNGKTLFERKFKGKPLTVQFDEYSMNNVPIRANAVAIRDYE